MSDRLHSTQNRRVDRVLPKTFPVAEAFGPDARLVDDVHVAHHTVQVRDLLVLHAVFVQVGKNVGLHLGFRRTDKHHPDAFELGEKICQRVRGAALIELADECNTQAVQRAFAINGVEIQQRLRGMLSAFTVSSVDHWNGRNERCPFCTAFLVVPDYDDIAITPRILIESSTCSPSISEENTCACSVERTRPPSRCMEASKQNRVRVEGA